MAKIYLMVVLALLCTNVDCSARGNEEDAVVTPDYSALRIPNAPAGLPTLNATAAAPLPTLSRLILWPSAFGFCNPTAPPSCVDERFGFCLGDEEYPEEEIKVAMELSQLTSQFSYKTSLNDGRSRQLEIIRNAESGCLSQNLMLKPIRARNIDGYWRVIVQDASDIIQREPIVTCVSLDATCNSSAFFTPVHCHAARCVQQYLTRRLLSFDPCNPARGVFVDSFKMPSACSCRLSRMPC